MPDNKSGMLEITSTRYSDMEGGPVYLIKLKNDDLTINLTNYGCTLTAIYTACRNGVKKNIVAGYDSIEEYTRNPHYYGCVLGRYAGRIAGSKYNFNSDTIKLSQNEGANHLHGGFEGLNKKVWKIKSLIHTDENVGVIMEYISPDGEEGYPGNLWIQIKFTLNLDNQLQIEYKAKTDKSTPVNLSNHSYFNLSGFDNENILNHCLFVNAPYFTEKDEENLPTGNVLPVNGTPLDFLDEKKIGQDIDRIAGDEGYNFNYILAEHSPGEVIFAAELKDEDSGRVLKIYTDQPAMQLYTANIWDGTIQGQQGHFYQKYGAVALETQAIPDAPGRPGFMESILHPNADYQTKTIYEFTTE